MEKTGPSMPGPLRACCRSCRDGLDLPGSKNACEQGECGSCTVVMDDLAVCSCLVLAADADGADITTVEGLGDEDASHAVEEALLEGGGVQWGLGTPGFVARPLTCSS